MSDKHDCPHPDCSRQVARSRFACRKHWFQLPKYIRDLIWQGHRYGDTMLHRQAMVEARRWYEDPWEVSR